MRTRSEIHDAFVARFHCGERGEPATDAQLDGLEAALNTKLPAAYRMFMSRHGVCYTPAILSEIADGELGHVDVQEFFEPEEAIENTEAYWSGGMPEEVVGIASDCMGNMLGFHRRATPCDDAPVVFFDHDFVEVQEIAGSFDELLAWYLDHLKGEQPSSG